MVDASVSVSTAQIAEFCIRNHICRFSLFGSVLTSRFTPSSDIDVLVEFEPNRVPGYFGLITMEMELSELYGRKVDLRTPAEISRFFREKVLESAVIQYERR